MRASSLLMMLGLVAGCDGSSGELVVQLRTDYSPGAEFAVVRVEIELDGERVTREEMAAERGADFLAGVPVAEAGGLAPGTYLVRTQLLVSGGEMRAAQQTRVAVAEGRIGATVLITRDCEGITCPLGDDPPALIACRGGTCVDPQCTEETPEACPDAECSADGDCPAPSAPCGRAVCVSGVCLSAGDDAACASDEYCDPVMGCRLLSVPIPDSSVPDAAPGALGAPCANADACTSGYCVGGVCCASACDDSPGGCFVDEGTCTDGVTCVYAPRDVDVPCEGDHEECTVSRCDGAGACIDTPMPDDSPCSVGTCLAGCCRPSGTTGCQIFHESSIFTVPAGITALRVRAWGGGGGGGEITDADGGQGGAGGYVESTITVTPGQAVDVYVGGGGRSGTCGGGGGSGASNGGDGGATNGTGGIGNGLASGGDGGAGQGTGGRGGRAGYAGGGGGGGDSGRGGGGGGASEIQLIPGFSDLVAGGGGGGGGSDHSRGGHGGAACDLDGEPAPDPTDDTGGGGGGGTCIGDMLSSGSGRAPPEEAASAGAGIGGSGGRACWSSNGRPGKVIITY